MRLSLKEEIKEFTYAVGQNTPIKILSPCVWDILMKVRKGARRFFS
jgi:hypothetical protein